ncbi:MAG: hypothetical protein L3K16_00100 [Thermoplasmata archaeon]|nr:hypothetical protein [Thermoplasmata archaeon]
MALLRWVRPSRIPWGLVQLLANASMSIGLWSGRHSRWVRRRHLLAWVAWVAAAAAVVTVATVAVARDPARPPLRLRPGEVGRRAIRPSPRRGS